MLDKIIDRVLNRYYARKIKKNTHFIFKARGIDAKYEYSENSLIISTKKREYKDGYYIYTFDLSYDLCIYYLANIDELKSNIIRVLNEKYGGEK